MDSAATVFYVIIGLHVFIALVDGILGISREPGPRTDDDADFTAVRLHDRADNQPRDGANHDRNRG